MMKGFLIIIASLLVLQVFGEYQFNFDIGEPKPCRAEQMTLIQRVNLLGPYIGIISSGVELHKNSHFRAHPDSPAKGWMYCGRVFHVGLWGLKRVVIVETHHAGPINAALTTQCLIDHFKISHIVLVGNGGGIDTATNTGDVILSKQWAIHDEYFVQRAGKGPNDASPSEPMGARTNPGKFLSLGGNNGNLWPQAMGSNFFHEVNEDMYKKVSNMLSSITLESCTSPQKMHCLATAPVVRTGATGFSGSKVVTNAAYRDFLATSWPESKIMDMESYHVISSAHANDIPAISIRQVSSVPGVAPAPGTMDAFMMGVANKNAAKTLSAALMAL